MTTVAICMSMRFIVVVVVIITAFARCYIANNYSYT